MFQTIGLINYPVNDLGAATKWYTTMLATEPIIDTPAYVGYEVNGLRIGLNPAGYDQGMTGPVIFWLVDNVEEAMSQAKTAGATVSREPQQMGEQILASMVGADGLLFGFIQITTS